MTAKIRVAVWIAASLAAVMFAGILHDSFLGWLEVSPDTFPDGILLAQNRWGPAGISGDYHIHYEIQVTPASFDAWFNRRRTFYYEVMLVDRYKLKGPVNLRGSGWNVYRSKLHGGMSSEYGLYIQYNPTLNILLYDQWAL